MKRVNERVPHLGASVPREENVETFDVTVNNADQWVMNILQKRRHFAHTPDAFVRRRWGIAAQFIEPCSSWHPLHNDEGIRRSQACCDDVDAVRMAHLKKNDVFIKRRVLFVTDFGLN